MRALVIFDSNYGNSKVIAEIVAKELDAQMISVSEFTPNLLHDTKLLVVGGPINWWRPSRRMRRFLSKLTKNQLAGMKSTSFDTRTTSIFPWNDAMKKISRALEEAGAEIVVPPHSFTAKGKIGPLAEGEIEKAVAWARSIKNL